VRAYSWSTIQIDFCGCGSHRDELNSANSTNVCCCPKVLPCLFLQALLNVKGGEVELDFTGFSWAAPSSSHLIVEWADMRSCINVSGL
jgi:hypothetical protein